LTIGAISNQPTVSTGFLQLPSGTTAQRSTIITVTTATGGTRYYTTSSGLFVGTSNVHIFTASGFFTASSAVPVSFLAVAGGGSGGWYDGAGGGAGGMVTGTFVASQGVTYTVTVGGGGTPIGTSANGNPGNPSSIVGTGTSITALGGGGGGSASASPG
jgi:hypothetical protein